jgi:hypothetical protein
MNWTLLQKIEVVCPGADIVKKITFKNLLTFNLKGAIIINVKRER